MAEKLHKLMNDSPVARWTVLILVALMMFFAYMFVDVMSPLKSLVESKLGWDSGVFGTYAASEYILNVCGFLIIAGVILDKLGVSFSLVPAALWPSVPKIIDEKILGSAYCLIFWVQNIGLCLVPMLIGSLRQSTGSYLVPMIVFSSFGILAFILSFYLKAEDRKKGYGLELPNIQK